MRWCASRRDNCGGGPFCRWYWLICAESMLWDRNLSAEPNGRPCVSKESSECPSATSFFCLLPQLLPCTALCLGQLRATSRQGKPALSTYFCVGHCGTKQGHKALPRESVGSHSSLHPVFGCCPTPVQVEVNAMEGSVLSQGMDNPAAQVPDHQGSSIRSVRVSSPMGQQVP